MILVNLATKDLGKQATRSKVVRNVRVVSNVFVFDKESSVGFGLTN
jgi:hypothetical protein